MMARLLTDEAPAPGPPAPTRAPAPRKLSFKTRQPRANHLRATRVQLSSSNVALIASKFNTIVIDEGAESRALLRKLSHQRRPSAAKDAKSRPVKRGEGVVQAAIELFEPNKPEVAKNVKPVKKTNSRPKIVVVRKLSNRPSTISDDLPNPINKECAKDSNFVPSDGVGLVKNAVKRKPSLKAKPVLRRTGVKDNTESLPDKKISRCDQIDISTNAVETATTDQLTVKSHFLNERIAQFNKNKLVRQSEGKVVHFTKACNTSREGEKGKLINRSDEKENKQEITKSILRKTSSKQSSLIEQTKDRLATIVKQNNSANLLSTDLRINTIRKETFKDKFTAREKKDLKVFHGTVDKAKDIEHGNRLSLVKDSILESSEETILIPTSQDTDFNTCKSSEPVTSTPHEPKHPTPPCKPVRLKLDISTKDTIEDPKQRKVASPSKETLGKLKPAIKPYSCESPKSEKKNCYLAPDPCDNLQLDRIKPNNSFLWKPSSRMSLVTEVPIYDDRPESQNNNTLDNDLKNMLEADNDKPCEKEETKTGNALEFDVASSFILEMTEQIERRFSSSSQEKEPDEKESCAVEESENIVQNNTSFLHSNNTYDEISTIHSNEEMNKKLDTMKMNLAQSIINKPVKAFENLPPQLPDKKSSKSSIHLNGNHEPPPPVPSSNLKPKLTHTPSEESWLNNCKKILEIPPPLRIKKRDGSDSDSVTLPRMTEDLRVLSDKRFSVSQVELLRRMSEMNLNKRNSLPLNSGSLSSYIENDDHYSSIPGREADGQDTYEAIGENSYAEIEESEERDDGNNIYDDVIGGDREQDPDDHYEAINCATQGDSDSSCDQSNSLYGRAMPASGLYQGSETSDEWVDMDNSDDQNESVLIFREKERGRSLSTAESWSMKVRRQWSRQAADPDDGSDASVPRSYENIAVDETSNVDDFDDSFSDSSLDHEAVNPNVQVTEEKRPQPLTEGIYGLMKQAGQRMRKHWTLGKTLTRMRKNKSTSSIQVPPSLGQRGWSFKRRDKPSTAQSTFYLHNTLTRDIRQRESQVGVDPRRLSTTSMVARPTSPPPPPPPRNSVDESARRRIELNSSNNSSGDNEGYVEGQRRLSRNGNSMWYIETSTTDSASEHGSSQGSDLNLRFADEPLYQFYAANAELDLGEDSDGYEEISPPPPAPALDLVAVTHHRTLWCEVPQVKNSGVLDTLNMAQKKLQEVKFEVMTSEASYFKSLTVLDKLFASCPIFCDENILARDDKKTLFGNVSSVRKCSEKLLVGLQKCWQDCILLQGLCEVVHEHAVTHCQTYVNYCTNQISMDRTLKMLKQTNGNFSTVLSQLELEPECQSLTLYSFLMLPMQRITRLRLLFDTMLSLLEPSHADFPACQQTLDTLNKCVSDCNEGARTQERLEEMVRLSKQLEFPPEMRIPILGEGSDRWLVRSGQVTQVNMDAKHTFGRRLSRAGPKFTLFLFTDLFLVTKKKSEESYLVTDHCQRSLLEARELRDFPGNNRFLLILCLLQNHDNKTVEMTVSCEGETERQRWLQVLSVPQSDVQGETLYEGWDCPQVTSLHSHAPSQPDELALQPGDVINVLRKTEGWFYGERTRDGEKGWFPGSYTREIVSKHVRARNLKQRHRLLQLSADLVQQQRKIKS